MKKTIIFILLMSLTILASAQRRNRAPELGARDAFFAFAKLSEKDIDELTTLYLCRFNQRYFSANEFDRRQFRSEARRSLENGIENATNTISQTYFIRLRIRLEDYDFDRGGFDIYDGLGGGWQLFREYSGWMQCPPYFNVQFTNGEDFPSFIEVDEARARELVRIDEVRRSRDFDWNRRRLALVEYLFVIDPYAIPFVSLGTLVLPVKILQATIYEANSSGTRSNRVLKEFRADTDL